MIKLGNYKVKKDEISHFQIERVTSVDIRVYIYSKRKSNMLFWTRVSEEELKILNEL